VTDPFDPARLAAPPAGLPPPARPPRHAPGEPFLKGPIPWGWLTTAAALPGQALAVGLVAWFRAGCENRRTVTVTLARLTRMGMSESTARRGLRALEGAGLVTTERRPGRAARVTLLTPPPAAAPDRTPAATLPGRGDPFSETTR
jgi:hypothetical protein